MSLINVILLNVGQENAILLFVALPFGILFIVAFLIAQAGMRTRGSI
jgi:hypothetical protein